MNSPEKASKWFFQDNTGTYVIGQPPNVLVYIMAIAFVGQLLSNGKINSFFDLLFFGTACAWSYLEIQFGESVFRRALGVTVLITIFASRLI